MKHIYFRSGAASFTAGLAASLTIGAPICAQAAAPHHHPAQAAAFRPASIGALTVGTQRPAHEVLLSTGEGELVTLPVAVASVWTSNPDVADVYVDNARQIHLFGKAAGQATVFASTGSGAVAYAARIRVGQNISSLDRLLKLAMPDAEVKVTVIGQFAMLTGTVAAPEDSAEAAKLVLVALNPGMKPSEADTAKIGIINRLRTAVPLQVNLQVRIAEVSRSLARQIGNNFASATSRPGGFQYAIGQGSTNPISNQISRNGLGVGEVPKYYATDPTSISPSAPLGTIKQYDATGLGALATATTLALQTHFLGLDIISALNLGEQVGLVTTLAQPNLTAVSGETAEFLVGGEFPIPMSQGLGAISIDYKKYGVSLSYTPTVLADGRISLRVRPEVSELSAQGAVTLNGFTVPALTVRRAETTVELGSGQSFMIAGLLSNNAANTIQKMPGAGDLPILGALFKSTNFQKSETELVIVITPYLVTPVNDRDIKLPTDAVKSPTIIQEVLGNMASDGASQATRPLPTSQPAPAIVPRVGAEDPALGQAAKAMAKSPGPQAAAPGFNLN